MADDRIEAIKSDIIFNGWFVLFGIQRNK
jgi:hypothetical protein